jgi:hypothetical protein
MQRADRIYLSHKSKMVFKTIPNFLLAYGSCVLLQVASVDFEPRTVIQKLPHSLDDRGASSFLGCDKLQTSACQKHLNLR